MWRHQNLPLLLGMKPGAAAVENGLATAQDGEHRNAIPRHSPKKNGNMSTPTLVHECSWQHYS